ncbi:MAG: hypothetical protein KGJ57_19300 [Sphingomonadales bacterium]|nr:hypothetical protein [Sphingomonadales bacterium]MDE2171542.1 hypothetical protein [Sphingomonadales bacterium]
MPIAPRAAGCRDAAIQPDVLDSLIADKVTTTEGLSDRRPWRMVVGEKQRAD